MRKVLDCILFVITALPAAVILALQNLAKKSKKSKRKEV